MPDPRPAPLSAPAAAPRRRGPRTPEGKARSALNALKHGLRARRFALLPHEDPAEFEGLAQAVRAVYRPACPVERELVEAIAAALWREMRADRLEGEVLADIPPADGGRSCGSDLAEERHRAAFALLLRYRAQAAGALRRAQDALERHRRLVAEAAARPAPPEAAAGTDEFPAPAVGPLRPAAAAAPADVGRSDRTNEFRAAEDPAALPDGAAASSAAVHAAAAARDPLAPPPEAARAASGETPGGKEPGGKAPGERAPAGQVEVRRAGVARGIVAEPVPGEPGTGEAGVGGPGAGEPVGEPGLDPIPPAAGPPPRLTLREAVRRARNPLDTPLLRALGRDPDLVLPVPGLRPEVWPVAQHLADPEGKPIDGQGPYRRVPHLPPGEWLAHQHLLPVMERVAAGLSPRPAPASPLPHAA